jgi:hypothetical protein
MRRDKWNAIKHIERTVLSLEGLEEWEQRLKFEDCRDDEVCGEGWVVADLLLCDLRCLFTSLAITIYLQVV